MHVTIEHRLAIFERVRRRLVVAAVRLTAQPRRPVRPTRGSAAAGAWQRSAAKDSDLVGAFGVVIDSRIPRSRGTRFSDGDSDRSPKAFALNRRPAAAFGEPEERHFHTGSICVPKRTQNATFISDFSACDEGLMRPYPEDAAFLRIGRSKIFELMAKGILPTLRVFDGGPRRISKAALVRYLNARVLRRAL